MTPRVLCWTTTQFPPEKTIYAKKLLAIELFFFLQYTKFNSSGVVAGGSGGAGGPWPPSENFLGALKSKGGAKIRNCQYLTKYVKSSLSTDSKR